MFLFPCFYFILAEMKRQTHSEKKLASQLIFFLLYCLSITHLMGCFQTSTIKSFITLQILSDPSGLIYQSI